MLSLAYGRAGMNIHAVSLAQAPQQNQANIYSVYMCPKDLGHVDLRITIDELKVSGLRRCWDKRKIVPKNGLYDTRPRRIRQNTLILSTQWLYSPQTLGHVWEISELSSILPYSLPICGYCKLTRCIVNQSATFRDEGGTSFAGSARYQHSAWRVRMMIYLRRRRAARPARASRLRVAVVGSGMVMVPGFSALVIAALPFMLPL